MKSLLTCVIALLVPFASMAEHHDPLEAEVRDTVKAFNSAYANDEVETYFSYYADDAMVYFYGARQDLSAYQDEWAAMVGRRAVLESHSLRR
jgi:ketosteroid isomerase-like protein